MGRTPGPRRSVRSESFDETAATPVPEVDPPEKETFPRRYPRFGTIYQTKVPKFNANAAESERLPPDLMSPSCPFISLQEASKIDEESKDAQGGHSSSAERLHHGRHGYNNNTQTTHWTKTQRGGTLVQKSHPDNKLFEQYVQPFFQSFQDEPPSSYETTASVQHMIQLHAQTTPKKRSRAPRGRKRVVPDQNSVVDELEAVWRQDRERNTRQRLSSSVGSPEDDSAALEYLHKNHGGDVASAQLGILVQLSGGKASKTRNVGEKRRRNGKIKLPPVTTSQSWKQRYAKTFPSLLGRVQPDIASKFFVWPVQAQRIRSNSFDVGLEFSDAEDCKGAWRSVLAFGTSMERQLSGESTSTSKKLLLSTAIKFIQTAYSLPLPETCFGSKHIMIEEVSTCIHSLLDHIDKARSAQSTIMDMLYDEEGCGIDTDALQKFLDQSSRSLQIKLDEHDSVSKMSAKITAWDARVDQVLDGDATGAGASRDDVVAARHLLTEAETLGFKSKSVVQLESRIKKACQVRSRIEEWIDTHGDGEKASTKSVATLVREANRLKLVFPELTKLTNIHRESESWVDRANIAIRSRISLTEIKSLISRGEAMPFDLSDYIEKLNSRVEDAEEWIEGLYEAVPCAASNRNDAGMLAWMKTVRAALRDGSHSTLHDLASGGNRIPVDVDLVKLLQAELDARSWSTKANRWIPSKSGEFRRGKLGDLRDHTTKAQVIRERLPLPANFRDKWILDGEPELLAIVETADSWFQRHKVFLEGDNRKTRQRCCISVQQLRDMNKEMNEIHANVGNASSKVTRILFQAESWVEKYTPLLRACGIVSSDDAIQHPKVTIEDIKKAADSGASGISINLDEAVALKNLVGKISHWFGQASILAPFRANKRQGKAARQKFTVKDLKCVIEASPSVPVDTSEEVERLEDQLKSVVQWQLQASQELEKVALGFDQLRESIDAAFGAPKSFTRDKSQADKGSNESADSSRTDAVNGTEMDSNIASSDVDGYTKPCSSAGEKANETEVGSEMKSFDTSSTPETTSVSSDTNQGSVGSFDSADASVHRIIRSLADGAKQTSVTTAEGDTIELMVCVSKWCIRSLKYLHTPREIFDKRYFGAFDRFVKEGKDLLKKSKKLVDDEPGDFPLALTLGSSWGAVVSDQLERLTRLEAERKKFVAWCKSATQILSDDKKLTIEILMDSAEKSRDFPAVSDIVHKVRGLAVKASQWIESTRKLIASGNKLSLQDAKIVLETGEKLKVNSHELRLMRTTLREVRSWCNRVKKCNADQGSFHVDQVQELINEHSSFIVEMPEELDALNQATRSYCVCRRPYEGFMIGCDRCEEWYHGPCIGVTESRADRFDKFVCVRCSVKKVFVASCSNAVTIVRKWTCRKDMKKCRQIESQKHQRKARKEMKDMEKIVKEIAEIEQQIAGGGGLPEAEVAARPDIFPSPMTLNITSPTAMQPMVSLASPLEVHSASGTSITATDGLQELGSCQLAAETDLNSQQDSTATMSIPIEIPSRSSETVEELEHKLQELREVLAGCRERFCEVEQAVLDRKVMEAEENKHSDALRRWCIRVRSLVLIPSSKELVEAARPLQNGTLSGAMLMVMNDSHKLGIGSFADIDLMLNWFKCICWSLMTLSILTRRPTLEEVSKIIADASSIQLPDEKAYRTIKAMLQKASHWQQRVCKALAPKPGQSKPISMTLLKDIMADLPSLPVLVSEGSRLEVAIDDKGTRYCICCGPKDENLNLCCFKCKAQFHDKCIKIQSGDEIVRARWMCYSCEGREMPRIEISDIDASTAELEQEITFDPAAIDWDHLHAPNPVELWPPYGYFGSAESSKALGDECNRFPDDIAVLHKDPSQNESESEIKLEATIKSLLPPEMMLDESIGCRKEEVTESIVFPCSQLSPAHLVHGTGTEGHNVMHSSALHAEKTQFSPNIRSSMPVARRGAETCEQVSEATKQAQATSSNALTQTLDHALTSPGIAKPGYGDTR